MISLMAVVTDEALYALNEESHGMWSEQGMDAPWMHLSFPEFQQAIRGVVMFVALDAETGELLGCIASGLVVNKVGAMVIVWLLPRRHSVRVLPRGCWPTKQSAFGRLDIAI